MQGHFLGHGVVNLPDLKDEIDGYFDILTGRVSLPVSNGILSLMEASVAMYVRVSEISAMIRRGEQEGTIVHNSSWYKFRIGECREFLDACKRAIELGSRRVTQAKIEQEMREWEMGDG